MSTVAEAALADCGPREKAVSEVRQFLHGELFAALADPARREVILLLGLEGELNAGAISARFGLDRTTVSRHLGRLTAAGLIARRKVGREVLYRLEADTITGQLEGLVTGLKTHCRDCC